MKILITGAASGVGAALSRSLSNLQNELVLVDINKENLEALSLEIKSKLKNITLLEGDLSNDTFLNELERYIQENPIDVLVNNAGITHSLKLFSELESNQIDKIFKVNFVAPFRLIQSALSVNQNALKIINIASRANIYGYQNMGIYAASKAALTSINQTVALENPSVQSVAVILGRTNTPMQANLRGEEEAKNAQSPEFVSDVLQKLINNQIHIDSGDFLLIDNGEYRCVKELFKADLHFRMNTKSNL